MEECNTSTPDAADQQRHKLTGSNDPPNVHISTQYAMWFTLQSIKRLFVPANLLALSK